MYLYGLYGLARSVSNQFDPKTAEALDEAPRAYPAAP